MLRRLSPIALIIVTGLVSLAAMLYPSGGASPIRLVEVARLDGAVAATAVPGDPTRVAIATRRGAIDVLQGSRLVPLDDVSRGLGSSGRVLSLAFAPDYVSSGLFYVYAVDAKGRLALWQRHVPAGRARAERRGRRVLAITVPATVAAGQIAFGPDGLLWIGTPDPSGASAQDRASPLGKLLRIDPSPSRDGAPFTIPRDQTSITPGTLPEVFARGLREPRAFTFASATGALSLVDHNELNRIDASIARGANFEWACNPETPCGGSFIRPSLLLDGPVGAVESPPEIGSGTLVATPTTLLLAAPAPDGTPTDFRRLRGLEGARALVANANGEAFVIDGQGAISRLERRSDAAARPVATIRLSPEHPVAGDSVTLDGRTSAIDGASLRYAWDTDGDGEPEGTRPTFRLKLTSRPRLIALTVDDGRHTSRRVIVLPLGAARPLDLTAPVIAVRVRAPETHILRVTIRSNEPALWRVWAAVSGAQAGELGLASRSPHVELAARALRAGAGRRSIVLMLPARLRKLGGRRIVVSARAVDPAGNAARTRVTVRLG